MKPKRSLGQNFFINRHLGEKIVSVVLENNPSTVIEIGPGEGFFTQLLAEKTRVVAIEKDDILALNLHSKIPSATIVNNDFLDLDISRLVSAQQIEQNSSVIFGSLPYNISKKIIRQTLATSNFKSLYFIIQKEVAEKYCSKPPDNNPLAIELALFADIKKLFDISPESFRPRPKVTSSFIKISRKESTPTLDFIKFSDFVHLCFQHPRRTLRNNLKNIDGISLVASQFLDKRPQELDYHEFITLFETCYNGGDETK